MVNNLLLIRTCAVVDRWTKGGGKVDESGTKGGRKGGRKVDEMKTPHLLSIAIVLK